MAKPRTNPVNFQVPGTLSFPNLLVPKQFTTKPGERERPAKYGCIIIWDASADLTPLKQNAAEARKLFFGGTIPRGLKSPFRKCEEYWETDAETGKEIPQAGFVAGGTFISFDFGDRQAPECWDQKGKVITDPRVLYPGCKVIIVARAQGYDFEGKNKGVKFYGLTLQKVGEGENIAGRVSAADYFKPVTELESNATTGATTGDGWEEEELDEENY